MKRDQPLRTTDGFDLMKAEDAAAARATVKSFYNPHENASQMNREHAAWRQVCKHLAKLGVDINKQDPLACAIRLWGEELVALRKGSTDEGTERARLEFASHVIRDGKP